ncbi:hypothetical protein [Paracoccus alkanivorans]|nr:hypothetical protein [Paracoccus alkanivorans]
MNAIDTIEAQARACFVNVGKRIAALLAGTDREKIFMSAILASFE